MESGLGYLGNSMRVHITLTDENGKQYHGEADLIESKITSISSKPKSSSSLSKKIPEKVVELIARNLDKLKIPVLVLIALKFYGPLTKSMQKEILEGWGKKVGENLSGGNYNRDLTGKILIREIGKSKGKSVYELTAKGKIEADKSMKQLEEGIVDKKQR